MIGSNEAWGWARGRIEGQASSDLGVLVFQYSVLYI